MPTPTPLAPGAAGWWCPSCALSAVGLLCLLIALLTAGPDGADDRLRAEARDQANRWLAEAGFPWARLDIDDAVGRLVGEPPDEFARRALRDLAAERLGPMIGLPGVVARLEDALDTDPTAAGTGGPLDGRLARLPGATGREPGPGLDAQACGAALATALQASPLRFDRGSSRLAAGSEAVLDRLVAVLGRCAPARISVEGHTDRRGSARANQRLSENRAQAVLEGLRQRGLQGDRHQALGWGSTRPLVAGDSDAAHDTNRRIAILVQADVP